MTGRHRNEKAALSRSDVPLSDQELVEAALALTTGDAAYRKTFWVRGRAVKLENRGPTASMGRFGGGWDRQLGIQLGRDGFEGTIIVNLWKGSIRIDPKKKVTA